MNHKIKEFNLFYLVFNKLQEGIFDVKLNPITLSFPDELEGEFQKDYYHSSLGFLRISFLLGITYYFLFAILDAYALPQIKEQLYIIRFFIVSPIILILFSLSFTKNFQKWWQFAAFLTSCVAGIGIILMIIIAPEIGKQTYYVGIIIVLIYCYLLIKLRFIWSSLAGLIIMLSYLATYIAGYAGDPSVFQINIFFLISANLLGMFGGYCLEFYTRKEFYFRYQLHQERNTIENMNEVLETKVKEKTKELEADIIRIKVAEEKIHQNLKEKNLLLKELYHRTKNNMQVIASMLRIQAQQLDDKKLFETYREVIAKIKSMAIVHQMLYEAQNLSQINLGDYIVEVTRHLQRSYRNANSELELKYELQKIHVTIDTAIPLSLVITELISNIYKHAFPNGGKGQIKIKLFEQSDEKVVLKLEDNGVGLPADVDLRQSKSMGLQNAFALTEYQLNGKIEYYCKAGLHWHITFEHDLNNVRV